MGVWGVELQGHERVAPVKKRHWEEGNSAGVSVADGPREETPWRPKRLMELCPEQKAKGGEKNERVLSLHGTRDPGSSVQVWAPPLEQRVKEAEAVLGGTAEGKAHVTEPWQKPATAVTPAVEGLRTEPHDRQQPAEAHRAPCC